MPKTERTPQESGSGGHEDAGRHTAERARPDDMLANAGDRILGETLAEKLRGEGAEATREALAGSRTALDEVGAGFDALTRELVGNAGRLFDQSSRTMQDMWQARTVQDVVRLQLDFASALMDAQLRYVEAMGRAASQLGNAGGLGMQRMLSLAAAAGRKGSESAERGVRNGRASGNRS